MSLLKMTCLALTAVMTVFAAEPVIVDEWVTVKSVIGTAEVRRAPDQLWHTIRMGMKIQMTWDVRTQAESRIELEFESRTVIRLGESSTVSLSTLMKKNHIKRLLLNQASDLKVDSLSVISVTDVNSIP